MWILIFYCTFCQLSTDSSCCSVFSLIVNFFPPAEQFFQMKSYHELEHIRQNWPCSIEVEIEGLTFCFIPAFIMVASGPQDFSTILCNLDKQFENDCDS